MSVVSFHVDLIDIFPGAELPYNLGMLLHTLRFLYLHQ